MLQQPRGILLYSQQSNVDRSSKKVFLTNLNSNEVDNSFQKRRILPILHFLQKRKP